MDYSTETHGHLGRTRHGSKIFYDLLEEMAALHDAKSHDYATAEQPFGNYEFAGNMAIMFSHNAVDAGFSGRLAEKLYRLYVLESGGKIPKTDSIADTERDLAVIMTLWMAARKDKREKEKIKLVKEQFAKAVQMEEEAASKPKQTTAPPKIGIVYNNIMTLLSLANSVEKQEILHWLQSPASNSPSKTPGGLT